jgi:6-pyruvoyltetrahydropterin/6-carboxytetrahydropterin synthase
MWLAIKTHGNNEGLSCCFRQWRADHSHCSQLHGYALGVEVTFEADTLDHRNWVMDFGGLKAFKAWLHETFDHTTVIASDDPLLSHFRELHELNAIKLVVFKDVGCEKFAFEICQWLSEFLDEQKIDHAWVRSVRVFEHDGNSATYEVDP